MDFCQFLHTILYSRVNADFREKYRTKRFKTFYFAYNIIAIIFYDFIVSYLN